MYKFYLIKKYKNLAYNSLIHAHNLIGKYEYNIDDNNLIILNGLKEKEYHNKFYHSTDNINFIVLFYNNYLWNSSIIHTYNILDPYIIYKKY